MTHLTAFLSSMAKGCFCPSNILALERLLNYRGLVSTDFGYNTDVLKASKHIIDEEMLS